MLNYRYTIFLPPNNRYDKRLIAVFAAITRIHGFTTTQRKQISLLTPAM